MSKHVKNSVNAKLGNEEILQAVVLADDFSSKLFPLENTLPSILTPVVNVPLLDYLIETLIKSRVHELYLYCSNHIDLLKKYISEKATRDITISLIISDGCRSLGDALRDIDTKGLIRGYFILIRGDSFINADLGSLLNVHRTKSQKDKGATMSLILRNIGSANDTFLKDETALLVANRTNKKVLFFKKLCKDEKKVKLELEWFLNHDEIAIHTSFIDTHVYLCSPSVLPLFSDNFDFQTMEDFVKGVLINEEILDSRIYWQSLSNENYGLPITSWKSYHTLSRDILQRRCYPLTPDTLPSLRNFVYMSRNTYKHHTTSLAKGCVLQNDTLIGKNTSLGKNTFVVRSIVGDNCKIEENVRTENSYILQNTKLCNNTMIKDSVVFPNCVISENVALDGCIVFPNVKILSAASYENSVIQLKSNEIVIKDIPKTISDSDDEFLYFKGNICDETLESKSDTEESSDDERSTEGSPIPDDTNMFLTEVIDSLLRGFQDKLNCENLILEINSSRYAYNVNIREVSYNVMKAILCLPLHHLSETKTALTNVSYQKTLKIIIQYFNTIIFNYIKTNDAQEDCLRAIEDVASTTPELLSFVQHLLHLFYDKDVLSEEKILQWFNEVVNNDNDDVSRSKAVREAVKPFIKWLEEAEEDSSDE